MPAWLYAFSPSTSLLNSTHLRFAYSKNHLGTVVALRCCSPLPSLEVTWNVRSLVSETSAQKPKNSADWSYISFQELAERIWGVIKTFLFNDYFMKSRHLSSWLMCKEIIILEGNRNLEMLVFEEGGKTGVPGEKPLGARERTNNKINQNIMSTPRFEPGPLWWEASAVTTAEGEENLCRSPLGLNENSNVFRPVM